MSSLLAAFRATSTAVLDASPTNRRLLYAFSGLAVFIAVQIMHLALSDLTLNFALSIGLVCGYLFSFNLESRWRPATTYGVSGLSMVISLIYFLKIQANGSLYGNYIGILAGILIVLLAFKAFSPSDHRFMLMFSMVFLLYSSVASFDLKYMILLPLFLLSSGMALYIANQIEVAVRVQESSAESKPGSRAQRYSQPELKFTFDASFSWVLIRAVLGIIVLASIAYILIPHSGMKRRGTVLATSPRVGETNENVSAEPSVTTPSNGSSEMAEIGLGEGFDLTDERRLSVNPKPVLKVRSHRSGYLRAKVFDTYTGTSWEMSQGMKLNIGLNGLHGQHGMFQENSEDPSSYHVKLIDFPSKENHAEFLKTHGAEVITGNVESRNDVELSFDILRQEITLLEEQPAIFFAVYQPFFLENISLNLNGKMHHELTLNNSAIVQAETPASTHPKDFSYTVYSLQPRILPDDLKNIINNPPDPIRDQYGQLPWAEAPIRSELNGLSVRQEDYRPISSGLRNFALTRFAVKGEDEVGLGVPSTRDVVLGIYDFLTDPEEFTYMRGFDYPDSELELTESFCMPATGTQEGYCRQFASAMAVLCRINGIPARIVTGYAPGSYSFVDNAYVYKASDAHAWVEVYFDGYGWVLFDPSPASDDSLNQNEARLWIEGTINFLQELFVIDPASTRETIMLSLVSLWELIKQHTKTVVLGGLGLIIMLATGWWLVSLMRRKRQQVFVAENPVIASYLGICTNLRQLGCHQQLSQTARSFLRTVANDYPQLAPTIDELLPVYECSAYSAVDVTERMEQTALHSAKVVARFVDESKQQRKQT